MLYKISDILKGEELIIKCQKGDTKAQNILYERYATPMYHLCYRYVKDQFEAEDVLVKGFYKVFKSISSFQYQDESKLTAWVKKIMVNECLMLLRQTNNFNYSITDEFDFADEINIESNLTAENIYSLLLELPIHYRTVFNLFVIEGFSHKEIAKQLNISEDVSRAQLSRAKSMLRIILTKNDMRYAI